MVRSAVLAIALVVGLASQTASADQLVRGLSELQAASGGFQEVGAAAPDLVATSHALFLANLYGQGAQINADDAVHYVRGLMTDSNGYSKVLGMPADIEATRAAIVSYMHLKAEIPNKDELSEFVRSLFDVREGLFTPRVGDPADLRSTALAVECLDLLGDLERPAVVELLRRVKGVISERVVGSDSLSFSDDVSENMYGIFLAKKSGFQFDDVSKWAAFVTGLQNLDSAQPTYGGFFTSTAMAGVTATATADAALSLTYLGEAPGSEYPLYKYASVAKPQLSETAMSHTAIALTQFFKGSFKTQVGYDSNAGFEVGEQVMEGLKLTPKALVAALDGKVAHGGFDLSVKLVESGGPEWSTQLTFDTNTFIYNANGQLDTAGRLGSMTLEYTLFTNVYPIGDVEIVVTDTKKVGYNVNVDTAITYDGNKVEKGAPVKPGTEYDFVVKLSTASDRDFYQGDFVLTLQVLDASNVEQHREEINGADNTEPISLDYILEAADFPAGKVSFVFTVAGSDTGVHTTTTVPAMLDVGMSASSVSFAPPAQGGAYLMGETIEATMTPAVAGVPLSAANAGLRKFVMDVTSAEGAVVASVEGKAVEGRASATYLFSMEVPATLQAVGMSGVVFNFVAADGPSTACPAADGVATAVKVGVSLELDSEKEVPSTSDFTYGTALNFAFGISDRLSGSKIEAGETGSVVLALTSDYKGTESARVVATAGDDGFEAVLNIDINAVAGASTVSLLAISVDGTEVPVHTKGSQVPVAYTGVVGGEVDVDSDSFSTKSADASVTSFISTFSLSCVGQPLTGAAVTGSLLVKKGADYTPVVSNDVPLVGLPVAADANGGYSFSVTLPHEQAKSGEYKMEFLRETDDKALFEVSLDHSQVSGNGLFMQMQLATTVVLFAVYMGVASQANVFAPGSKSA